MEGLRHPALISEAREEAETLANQDPERTRWPLLWEAAGRRVDRSSIT